MSEDASKLTTVKEPPPKTLEEYEAMLVHSKWGRPSNQRSGGSKVFKGSSKDTAWNNDLLWKLHVEHEKHILPKDKEYKRVDPPPADTKVSHITGKPIQAGGIYRTTAGELGPTKDWSKPIYKPKREFNIQGKFTSSFRRGHKPAGFITAKDKSKIHSALDPDVGGKMRI